MAFLSLDNWNKVVDIETEKSDGDVLVFGLCEEQM
jgi:hypothetical protein